MGQIGTFNRARSFFDDPYAERMALAKQKLTAKQASVQGMGDDAYALSPSPDTANQTLQGTAAGRLAGMTGLLPSAVNPADTVDRARAISLQENINRASTQNARAKASSFGNVQTSQYDTAAAQDELQSLNSTFAHRANAADALARTDIPRSDRIMKMRELDAQALRNVTLANQTGNGSEMDPDTIAAIQARLNGNTYNPAPDTTSARTSRLGSLLSKDSMLDADHRLAMRTADENLRDSMKAGMGTLAQATLKTEIAKKQAEGLQYNGSLAADKNATAAAISAEELRKNRVAIALEKNGLIAPEARQAIRDDGMKAIEAAMSFQNKITMNGDKGLRSFVDDVQPRLELWAESDPDNALSTVRSMISKIDQEGTTLTDRVATGVNQVFPADKSMLSESLARRADIKARLVKLRDKLLIAKG